MYLDAKVTAIITAGGMGLRMGGDTPKQFLAIGGKSILERTVDVFDGCSLVDEILVTLPEDYLGAAESLSSCKLIKGGADRQESVFNALREIAGEGSDIVLVHDGVRPHVTEDIIERVTKAAYENGAALAGVPSTDTIRHKENGTLDRDDLFRVQTPQGFRLHIIKAAYEKAEEEGFRGTDDAGLVDRLGKKVEIVEGSERNIKITTRNDLPAQNRIGTGFDVHAFKEGRKLILCGVEVPSDKGLDGHSDADVATHALMDAILGAAALPDIGRLFPDSDDEFRGISSLILLERVMGKLREAGYMVSNVDITIICQAPKLAPYINEMRGKLAEAMGVETSCVGLKATTTERLGFTGRGEGIAAEAIALITDLR